MNYIIKVLDILYVNGQLKTNFFNKSLSTVK